MIAGGENLPRHENGGGRRKERGSNLLDPRVRYRRFDHFVANAKAVPARLETCPPTLKPENVVTRSENPGSQDRVIKVGGHTPSKRGSEKSVRTERDATCDSHLRAHHIGARLSC